MVQQIPKMMKNYNMLGDLPRSHKAYWFGQHVPDKLKNEQAPSKTVDIDAMRSMYHETVTANAEHVRIAIMNTGTAMYFTNVRQHVGGSVTLSSTWKMLPVLTLAHQEPICLFKLIDALDAVVDYDDVIAQLPGISYSQIYDGLRFLRKLVQFNLAGLDIEQLEAQEITQDGEFLEGLRTALRDKETMRVFSSTQSDNK